MVTAFTPRLVCDRCRRPRSVCYCAALPTLETRTRIVILQHPRERDMAIGTARMASLCLPNAELHVGIDWSAHAPLAAALSDPGRTPILLYPGPGARDILVEPPVGPVTLVVVDGTWSQAKSVVRDNPVLHALPRYAFATPEPSQYRIRREPRPEYCSTIEALMHVLGALEGDAARFRALLEPFQAMVDAQLACQARATSPRKRVPPVRPTLCERLPAALRERFEDLVLVVAEANAWPYRDGVKRPDELVHVAALRPATGERFDAIAAPSGALAPSTVFHTRLSEPELRAGGSRDELIAALASFAGPSAVLGAWGHYAPDLIRDAGGPARERVDLRAAAQRLLHRRLGGLEDFAATLAEPPSSARDPLDAMRAAHASIAVESPSRGRAGHRLAALARIVATWRALAAS